MKTVRIAFVMLALISTLSVFAQGGRWSEQKARDWQKSNGWFCGMNYIPSDAVNYTAMWDKTGFSPGMIEKEMKLAKQYGLNCARVVLQYAVYADDPAYFVKTFERFLAICDKYDVKVMPCFFDDCAFGVNTDPTVGQQPEPLDGWYAWAWSPSPGYSMVIDERTHGKLETYVKDIMTRYKNDDRVFVWDLYNEPTNTTMPERSMPLVKKVFRWAREVNPLQPLTIGIWNGYKDLNDFVVANSDIMTFHCYDTKEKTSAVMREHLAHNRPVICTEWMNRPAGSVVTEILPVFKENNVGSMVWGLVNGKTQTHLSWGHRPEHLPFTGVWQHDLFTSGFEPYKAEELVLIGQLTGRMK